MTLQNPLTVDALVNATASTFSKEQGTGVS